ncbi:MAG: membrane protein insertion efficiency factor YidD [Betaproteobacteria bacterium]|nr:membrane protein insertion efficiency factor YidD [Betaproteobacteria bacterium]
MRSTIDTIRPLSWTARIAIHAIALYQKHLSPHKGWSCAYRVHTGDNSCSQHAKCTIEQAGFLRALPLIWRRLRACGHAHIALSNQASNRKDRGRSTCSAGATKDLGAEACCTGCGLLSLLH